MACEMSGQGLSSSPPLLARAIPFCSDTLLGCFHTLEVHFLGVLVMRAVQFGAFSRATESARWSRYLIISGVQSTQL